MTHDEAEVIIGRLAIALADWVNQKATPNIVENARAHQICPECLRRRVALELLAGYTVAHPENEDITLDIVETQKEVAVAILSYHEQSQTNSALAEGASATHH